MQLSEEEKEVLLLTARNAIKTLFGDSLQPVTDIALYPNLFEKNIGAFVTLKLHSELRGCIGYLDNSDLTLYDTICQAAGHAAFNDPRFLPLSKSELALINIEISVLSSFIPIKKYEDIELGTHGLLLDEPGMRALLLPQVAIENNFNLNQFLIAICQKAGVDIFLWQRKKLNLKVFTATIFSEKIISKESYESA
jgi:AmmeMemoRadiSam system protein A